MQLAAVTLVLVAGAYLLGSIPTGYLVVRAFTGKDIRQHGSGNIGMANAFRVGGAGVALVVLLGDALKGAALVLVARAGLGLPDLAVVAIGLAAIVGHDFPIFLRGHGGKGIATSLGVITALAWPVGLAAVLVWLLVTAIWRYASLSSLLMLLSAGAMMFLYDRVFDAGRHPFFAAFVILLLVVAIVQHRANIDRLLHGRELKLSDKPGQPA